MNWGWVPELTDSYYLSVGGHLVIQTGAHFLALVPGGQSIATPAPHAGYISPACVTTPTSESGHRVHKLGSLLSLFHMGSGSCFLFMCLCDFNWPDPRASKVTQRGKTFAAKSDNLSSINRTHVERKELTSTNCLHTPHHVHMHPHTCTPTSVHVRTYPPPHTPNKWKNFI